MGASRTKKTEEALEERIRLSALRAEVSARLASAEPFEAVLHQCARGLVDHLGASQASIWTMHDDESSLKRLASAGISDSEVSPRGEPDERGLARIARDRRPHLTEDFAGYPLLVEDRILGVLAVAARTPLSDAVLAELAPLAGTIAQYIDRKRTAWELVAARRRLNAALIAAEAGTFEWDIVTDRLYGDANFEALFNIPLDSSRSAPLAAFIDAIHPEDRERTMALISQSVETGAPYIAEYRILDRDRTRWVIARGKVERNDAGTPIRFPGVLLDVTEKVEAEQARFEAQRRLEEQSRPFEIVLSSIVDFAYSFDRDGRFVFANKALLDLWGRTLEEAVGKDFFDLQYPAALATKLQAQIQQVFETKRPLSDETPYQSPTGVDGFYEYIFKPVFGADGSVELVAGSTRDISERKRMEQALKDADRRKDEFLAMLAHELRTPLTPISNALQTLAQPQVDGARVKPAVALMQRQLAHVLRLVDDLVDVSRISRGKIQLRIERVGLGAVVDHAVEAAGPLYESRGQELVVSLPTTPLYLDADGARLTQIVGNLLNNAAKYSDPGGHVRLSAELDPPGLTLRVKDDGIGIATEQLAHIFDMFTQVDTSLERSQGGLGLGLTLVKSLVEMHGGTISAHSDGAGKGSEFVIHLPKASATPQPMRPSPSRPARVRTRHRFVVAEDNRDAAESLGMWLEYLGHEVHLAFDGMEAVAAVARVRPDVALIDIGMPTLNGYDACRRIREEPWGKDVLLIALTGWSQDSDKRRTAEAGFDSHLVKPLDQAALQAVLSRLPPR